MLYQVILTEGELELLMESLEAAAEHYDEYIQHEDAVKVRHLIQSVELWTEKF